MVNWGIPSSSPVPFRHPTFNFGGFNSLASSQSASDAGLDSDFWSMSETSDLEGQPQAGDSSAAANDAINQLLLGFQDFRASSSLAIREDEALPGRESTAGQEPEGNRVGRKRNLDVGPFGVGGDLTTECVATEDLIKECMATVDAAKLPTCKKSCAGDISQQTLACPFWKRDPERHQRCGLFTLKRVRDVKQHLNRRHTPAFYCERCLVVFDSATDHESHLVYESCRREPSAELDGISNAARRKLCQRSDARLSIADQWFAIWDLLFPGVSRPRSSFVDSQLSIDLRLFSEYYRCRGSQTLMDLLNSNDVWSMSKEDQQVRSRQILEEGLNKIYDDWLISRSPGLMEAAPEPETTAADSFWGQYL